MPLLSQQHYQRKKPEASVKKEISAKKSLATSAMAWIGGSYEKSKPIIESKFTGDRKNNWSEILQFFYHIRNGCFHDNKFNILPNAISTNIPTRWRGQEIDYTDNGKMVAMEYLLIADIVQLLYDVQQELK